MKELLSIHAPGATPLNPDESAGLIPQTISTLGELNELEQENILSARLKLLGRRHSNLLTLNFVCEVHREMFGDVWNWAGSFRISDKNLGVSKELIREQLRNLLDDTKYWLDQNTYTWIELGARFHHRLVWIHPFANGNGRHARLMTDILLDVHGQKAFTWGSANLNQHGTVRQDYLAALKKADQADYGPLMAFVIS
jgi:Fic-DOC domain mobile mystery protein B